MMMAMDRAVISGAAGGRAERPSGSRERGVEKANCQQAEPGGGRAKAIWLFLSHVIYVLTPIIAQSGIDAMPVDAKNSARKRANLD
jgi:hypothetical protein